MNIFKNKRTVITISFCIVLIVIISYLYKISLERAYLSSVKEYSCKISNITEERMKENVDKIINSIGYEVDESSEYYSNLIKYVSYFVELIVNNIEREIGSLDNLIDVLSDFDFLKYAIIDNQKNQIIYEKNNVRMTDSIQSNEIVKNILSEFYKCNTIKYRNGIIVIGIVKEELNNDVVKSIKNRLEKVNEKMESKTWIKSIKNVDGKYALNEIVNSSENYKQEIVSFSDEELLKYINELKINNEILINHKYKDQITNLERNKIIYAKYYKPYDWIVGTEIYIDDFVIFVESETKAYKDSIYNQLVLIWLTTMLIIILAIVVGGLLYRYFENYKRILIERESEIIKNHYEILESKYNITNTIIHDFKNHLIVIGGLVGTSNKEEIEKYIYNINEDISKLSHIVVSRNKVVDIVINEKISYMKSKGIKFNYNIEPVELLNIDYKDLGTILGNLLDNAIEGAEAESNGEISFILKEYNNNFIAIKIENSCINKPNSINGKLITTKKNKIIHGYGLKNVRSCLNKYGGNITWEYDSYRKIFKSVVIIPK